MSAGTITISETRLSLLARVRNPADGRSWRDLHTVYQPLIFGYLRSLGVKEHDAHDRTQEVFYRLMTILPTFKLDRRRGRFRTDLWRLTYTTLIHCVRRKNVRDRAEEEWVRRFTGPDESASRKLKETWILQHRKRILEVVLPHVRAAVSSKAWACFEGRLVHRRAAAEIATELEIAPDAVYVHASRVLKKVRRRCAEIEEELGDGRDLDLS
jgi:RNA polymerase sigma factor (sigma-70 family)